MALHHDLILVLPSHKLEQILPARGIVSFRDPESGKEFLLDCSHKKTRQALEQKMRLQIGRAHV